MSYMEFAIDDGAFSVSDGLKKLNRGKKKYRFAGIPHSTLAGAMAVLIGERPQGKVLSHQDFDTPNLRWVSEILEGAKYKLLSSNNSSGLVITESIFGEKSKPSPVRTVIPSKSSIINQCGEDFYQAIVDIFSNKNMQSCMGDLLLSGAIYYEKNSKIIEKYTEAQKIIYKDKFARLLQLQGDQNWFLKASYFGDLKTNRTWSRFKVPYKVEPVKRLPRGHIVHQFRFFAQVFLPLMNSDTHLKMQNLLKSGPGSASFCRGGMFYPKVAISNSSKIKTVDFLPDDSCEFCSWTDLFSLEERKK